MFNYATLNQVQSDNASESVQLCDSGSYLDYSGCQKTHRFPPPYGLGSLSLTHRPTENPTGMTEKEERHTGLDPVSPALGELKTVQSFAICSTMRL